MASTSTSTTGEKWYFTKEQLENTPSRKCGFDALKELSYRQQAANFIQDMGQKLKVSQLCINTAIVYMHRFYVFHSFTHFPWHQMAAAALFLAAKVEEQPRKLEYVIKISNICRNGRDINLDVNSERYILQSQDLVFNENVLLQTLGFDVAIDHPHTHVVRCCHLVRASKDLAQTSYFMASNSLHLTTMCLQYKPTVVACFCILVACKWSNWEIPLSNEKKEWYSYVDPTVTAELLQQLTEEFLVIFEASPSRLKIASNTESMMIHGSYHHTNSPFDTDPKKITGKEDKSHIHRSGHESKSGSENDLHKHRPQRPHEPGSSSQQQRERDRNRDRERLAAQQQKALLGQGKVPMGHHRPPSSSSVDQRMKHPHSRPPPPVSGYIPAGREPRDILREAKESPFGLPGARAVGSSGASGDGKDTSKRDYNATVKLEPNSYGDTRVAAPPPGYVPDKRSAEVGRSKTPLMPKPYIKPETDSVKKHPNLTPHEKSNAYLNKPLTNAAAPKIEKPCVDPVKVNHVEPTLATVKTEPPNGNDNYLQSNPIEIKSDQVDEKEPITIIKRPSLFSPEQTPPHKKLIKTEPEIKSEPITPSLSPLSSPLTIKRNRNYSSSSSEPELRPVMKKIDQVEGFENLIRDNTIGINKHNQVGDNMEIRPDDSKSDVPSKPSLMVNGLETNPIVISNLLKETVPTPQLPSVTENIVQHPEKEHHHHKSKKKNKEKHKHKDKEKSREDKEKKKKHKDKDREKHHRERAVECVTDGTVQAEPIKLKIQKDRIHPVVMAEPAPSSTSSSSHSLKIKIPKDKIKTEAITELTQPLLNQPIKLKIPKEKLSNCIGLDVAPLPSSAAATTATTKRRERSSPSDAPPAKLARTSHHKETTSSSATASSATSKQNGRHSYGKVAQTGEGESSLHRLAESKYTHKNSTS